MTLTNHSSNTCHMDGFPGLDLLDASGKKVASAGRGCAYIPCNTTPIEVTIAPGQSGYFRFVWGDNPQDNQTCPNTAEALITPPNAYDHLTVPLEIPFCWRAGVGTVQPTPDTVT